MKLFVLALVFLSALLTAAANLILRRGLLRETAVGSVGSQIARLMTDPMFVGGVLLYGLAAVIWFRVLPLANLSTTYPLLVSMTFFMVTLGAVIVYQESVSSLKVAGLAFILIGIVLVTRA